MLQFLIQEIPMLMVPLSKAATVALLSFVVSSMLAMGAGLTLVQIVEPLRNARLVLLALFANFVLTPLGAFALAKLLWLDEPLGVGLLVLGCAAGAPFLPKLAEIAKGNLAFAIGVMVLLMVTTVAYVPFILPLLLPGVVHCSVEHCSFPAAAHAASARRRSAAEGVLRAGG
jgi:bile acid:Na+ symporter, BASS family